MKSSTVLKAPAAVKEAVVQKLPQYQSVARYGATVNRTKVLVLRCPIHKQEVQASVTESRTPVVHLLDARGAGAISEAFLLHVEKIILSRPQQNLQLRA